MEHRLRNAAGGGLIYSAITAASFYAFSSNDGDFARMFFGAFAVLAFPGIVVGTIVSGGLRGSAHSGGELWEVAVIAFFVNSFLYATLILVISSAVHRFRTAKRNSNTPADKV